MENDLPLPMPDRRIITTENNSIQNTENSNQNYNYRHTEESHKISDLKESKLSIMSTAQIMQTEDMRQKILSYKLLSEKTIYMNALQNDPKLKKCNIIFFGPSKAGKTSFIKSLNKALYNTSKIANENISKLVVRNKYSEDKTLLFSQYQIIKESNKNSGLMICDTRESFKLYNINNNKRNDKNSVFNSIESNSNVNDNYKILNMNKKSLLEFWQKNFDSFPKEIFREEIGFGNIRSLPHAVVFVFNGKEEIMLNNEELNFYKELIDISKNKGYKDVHVILTRFDEFEKKILEKNLNLNEGEIISEINKLKNIKIEKVISLLGVNWSNVHFIENYHIEGQMENSPEIDYNILKTLLDIINTAELFILDKIAKVPMCYGLCSMK